MSKTPESVFCSTVGFRGKTSHHQPPCPDAPEGRCSACRLVVLRHAWSLHQHQQHRGQVVQYGPCCTLEAKHG